MTINAAMRSFNSFRETWAKLYTDRLVKRAIRERPENAGHINTQMLATQSLAFMRDLSPEYLNRFVSYVETLLWLEMAGKEQ